MPDRLDGLRAVHAGQPQIHQRHVRPVGAEQRLRLLPGRRLGADRHVGLDRDDAGQSHADQVVIVDEHDLERRHQHGHLRARPPGREPGRRAGTVTARRVPAPGWLSISSTPPSLSTRSRIPCRPKWSPGRRPLAAPSPQPLSLTMSFVASSWNRSSMSMRVGAAVLERVGQRLETDPQEMMLLRGVEPLRVPSTPDLRRRARADRHLARELDSAPARSRLSSACDRRSITERRVSSRL